ncbi:alpha/beta fold hydrolase [Streptomyces sp. NBC_00820]|uniref:alpha/beta hydrolase n=1 Tax=Streptomyces sp. NBC_00820 TaxID=2975842 RepID=UPI002ED3A76C|nr:alpha/beta fold hydrolase [Streptomyces sp. NBC_00820]
MLAKLSTRPAVRHGAGAGVLALTLLGAGLPAVAAGRAEPDLSRFYGQKVTWAACTDPNAPDDLQCGKVTVPLDYARPGAGTLDLALARYRATGPSRGSVLLNFGGPGAPGVSQLAGQGKDFMDLTNGYDVVTFDPRGVGRSSPVSCGESADGADGAAEAPGNVDAARPQALLTRLQKSVTLCTKHSGPVLKHIGTVDTARDLDVIRQALGDRKLNYLGFSYGSRLGAVYAARFPQNVGRIALDGVDTLTESLADQGLAGVEGQQTALEDFLTWCTKDIACPFGQDRRAAGDQVVEIMRSLDAHPVPNAFGGSFSGQDLVGAIGQALYSRQLWPSLERALASLVQDGDTRGVLNFAIGGFSPSLRAAPHGTKDDPRGAKGDPQGNGTKDDRHGTKSDRHGAKNGGLVDAQDVPTDNLPAALMAINCADDPDRPTAARIGKDLKGLRDAYEDASPVFGPYRLSQLLMCYGRPKGTDYIRDQVRNVHSAKMLLVGTRGDPATPYRWTVETAKRLGPSAVVLDNKGDGHTGYTSSKCVHRKVNDFLLYGFLPPSGSSCLTQETGWSSGTEAVD